MKFPSAVFYAIRKARAALGDIAWSAHPVTGEVPQVELGDIAAKPEHEQVRLIGRVDDPAEQGFLSFSTGASKTETFALLVLVYTASPGMSEAETFDRLEELVGLLESSFRSSSTGLPTGLFSDATASDPQCIAWEVTSVNPAVFPAPEGFTGECWVTLGFHFRL